MSINGVEAIAPALEVVERLVPDARRVIGWATVDTDRFERDVVATSGSPRPVPSRDLPDDALLGARCRLLASGVGEPEILLLEPATEGRIAASLARYGEGPVVVYVVMAARFEGVLRDLRAAGLVLSGEAAGPFGRQRLVSGGGMWGPHLLIAEDAPNPPASSGPRAATIGR